MTKKDLLNLLVSEYQNETLNEICELVSDETIYYEDEFCLLSYDEIFDFKVNYQIKANIIPLIYLSYNVCLVFYTDKNAFFMLNMKSKELNTIDTIEKDFIERIKQVKEKIRGNDLESKLPTKITYQEFKNIFERDNRGAYTKLVIPAYSDFKELNLIGKLPSEYSMSEIVHTNIYKSALYDRIENYKRGIPTNYLSYVTNDKLLKILINNGVLKPMYIINPKFGGIENESNVLYVPEAVIQEKNRLDTEIEKLLKSGKEIKFSYKCHYFESSLIPTRVDLIINTGKNINKRLYIWNKQNIEKIEPTKKDILDFLRN